jgi:hypothetical protein
VAQVAQVAQVAREAHVAYVAHVAQAGGFKWLGRYPSTEDAAKSNVSDKGRSYAT